MTIYCPPLVLGHVWNGLFVAQILLGFTVVHIMAYRATHGIVEFHAYIVSPMWEWLDKDFHCPPPPQSSPLSVEVETQPTVFAITLQVALVCRIGRSHGYLELVMPFVHDFQAQSARDQKWSHTIICN